MIFLCQVKNNKVVLDHPSKFTEFAKSLNGKYCELILRKRKSKRSLDANNYYWGVVIQRLAEYLGYNTAEQKEQLHHALKEKFASVKDDNGLVMMESTAKMSTERFQKYLADIRQWTAEFLNYRLPEPNEIEEG